jgi:hypothetical protein
VWGGGAAAPAEAKDLMEFQGVQGQLPAGLSSSRKVIATPNRTPSVMRPSLAFPLQEEILNPDRGRPRMRLHTPCVHVYAAELQARGRKRPSLSGAPCRTPVIPATQLGKILARPHLNRQPGMPASACNPSQRGGIRRGLQSDAGPG